MTAEPLAIVIGDMDIVRPLGRTGIPVVTARHQPLAETRWSRYTEGVLDLPDLWNDPDGAVDTLNAFAQTLDEKPVLIYQRDQALLAISRFREKLEPHFRFVVPEADLAEALVDKSLFYDLSVEFDLPVPTSAIVECGSWSPEIDAMSFPVVVKPVLRNRSDEQWFPVVGKSAKAVRISSPEQLRSFVNQPLLRGLPVVVQRLIDGPEDRVWSYHAFIDDSHITQGEFVGRKIRTWPDRFGQSTAVEIVDNEKVAEIGRRVLSAVGFTGVAKVDLKQDVDGSLYLLEVNPRFSLWHHPGAVAGVNLPLMVYNHLLGRPSEPAVARPGVRWCQIWGDLPAARKAGVSPLEWARYVAGAETRRAAHLDDPGAAFGALLHGVRLRLGRSA